MESLQLQISNFEGPFDHSFLWMLLLKHNRAGIHPHRAGVREHARVHRRLLVLGELLLPDLRRALGRVERAIADEEGLRAHARSARLRARKEQA